MSKLFKKQVSNTKPEEKKELSPKELKIKALKEELKNIKIQGTFNYFYVKIRKESINIRKNDNLNDNEKIDKIRNLCLDIIKETEE